MKKLLTFTLITSLIASPVLAAQNAAQKQELVQDADKKKESKVWHVIKNYVLPGAGIICGALMLRWGWNRWSNRNQPAVWVLRTADDFKKLEDLHNELPPDSEMVAEIKTHFASKNALLDEATRLKNTKHSYISLAIPNTYADHASHRNRIGINIDRRNPNRPLYIFTNIQNRQGSCNMEPVRDFFATYDPQFDTSKI